MVSIGRGDEGQEVIFPVLVVSADEFNAMAKVPIVVPIVAPRNPVGFNVLLDGSATRTKGMIRCQEPRAIDLTARNGRLVESVPPEIMKEVLQRICAILEYSPG